VGIANTEMIQQGRDPLMQVVGKVENRGEATAYDFKLIIEMTPKDSTQKDQKVTKTITMGALGPGDDKSYVGHVQLRRGIDYKGSIKCEYTHDGQTIKGSTKSF